MPRWHSPKPAERQELPADAGAVLIGLARAAITRRIDPLADPRDPPPADRPGAPPGEEHGTAWLDAPGASFVTLHRHGTLRGCIGSLEARRTLRADVVANAQAAASRDRRFAPVTSDEVADLDIEVSVLGPPQALPVAGYAQAVAALHPGVDGVVIEAPGHRATFLPQVWASLPDPGAFLTALQRKAGLPPGSWRRSYTLSRYDVAAFTDARQAAGGGP